MLALILCCAVALGGQPARDFFDNTVIHEIRIDLDPADWASLRRNYLANTYYHAGVSSGPDTFQRKTSRLPGASKNLPLPSFR